MTNSEAVADPINNGEPLVQATHGSSDHPLTIGEIKIPCYVLEDGRRVLVRYSVINALDMSEGSATAGTSGNRLTKFLQSKTLRAWHMGLALQLLCTRQNGKSPW